MASVMVSLLGEQPIPNLLPIRYYHPDQVLLVRTERTERVQKQLEPLLSTPAISCKTEAYDIVRIQGDIEQAITGAGWEAESLIFNLTGGTKAMMLAGYGLAGKYGGPFLYLQTEGGASRVYWYRFAEGGPVLERTERLPGVITIDDYLKAHLGTYTVTGPSRTPGGDFEQAVAYALEGVVEEMRLGVKHGGALDLDLVIRCGNRVGIAQMKGGKGARKLEGLNHLAMAGGQRYLGTYTSRFLIINTVWDRTLSHLRDLAKEQDIAVVELPGYRDGAQLDEGDKRQLLEAVKGHLPCSGDEA